MLGVKKSGFYIQMETIGEIIGVVMFNGLFSRHLYPNVYFFFFTIKKFLSVR